MTDEKGQIIAVVKDKYGAPIVNAKVAFYKHDYGQNPPEFLFTGPDGKTPEHDFSQGKYSITCDAFVETPACDVEVKAGCKCEIPIVKPLGLSIASYIIKDCNPIPCDVVTSGTMVKLRFDIEAPPVGSTAPNRLVRNVKFSFAANQGSFVKTENEQEVYFNTAGLTGPTPITGTVTEVGSAFSSLVKSLQVLAQAVQTVGGGVSVAMRRVATAPTADLPLWVVIRKSTEALSFDNYMNFMNLVLCGIDPDTKTFISNKQTWKNLVFGPDPNSNVFGALNKRRFLPYNDADAYRLLKVATEAFVVVNCGVTPNLQGVQFTQADVDDLVAHTGVDGAFSLTKLNALWGGDATTGTTGYLETVNGFKTLLYLKLIRDKLPDVRLKHALFKDELGDGALPEECFGILEEKLTNPCLLELIWSYWHEEGMLVQTMNALSARFQNVRGPTEIDPLAMLEIDPLRPLNNLIWGYIQDEQHRLTVQRRAYEYDHHYGIGLQGKAVPPLRSADSRSKFLEEFHNLLYLCAIFFKEDDDTTVIADGFPVLNALKEVHFLLTEGAHNQFGDLPSTARQEMLLQQWLLARPEFREFLPTRIMVAYPEPWMDRVDAMKKLQGWTDSSIREFHELGVFGEKILLSIRYGAWGTVDDPVQAVNWARFWRAEIQGYTHSYRGVTGVDLTSEVADARQAAERSMQPSLHLVRRLAMQRRDGSRGVLTRPTASVRRRTQQG
jgi:hypothetical protein